MSTLPPALFKRWIHSREEDTGDVSVYRSSNYPFPPVRGRTGFEIRANGDFIAYDIAPTDGWLSVLGHWETREMNEIRVSFDDRRRTPLTLHIVSCDQEMLKITRR
jgi:hypothetical protein